MQDLFGQDVQVYRGQPVDSSLTEEEADIILDEMLSQGLLFSQMNKTLSKIKKLPPEKMTQARKDAWTDLIWTFDLWESPARISFEYACEAAGMKSEKIRCAISRKFGNELSLLYAAITAKHPDQRNRMIRNLGSYVSLSPAVH